MDGLNFFSWIRDGARRSVLLGSSDAVEHLGTPGAEEDLHPSVAGFLQTEKIGKSQPRIVDAQPTKRTGKKRLGKSLKDFGAEKVKAG